MNELAQEIGMTNTRIADTTGASEENVSTAQDLLLLAQHFMREYPDILALTKVRGEHGAIPDLQNYNHYADDLQFLGGKTGKTRAARETMLAIFLEEETPTGVRVYVVLGSNDAKGVVDVLRGW